ncbi:IS630 family transposase [Pseudenhygromyxa sp. WMMC2535]|uniref:IS630 family transposase n=1 Tax=Pseudenhygromyxa sp. WMMC2535 TaxID=2712867 RepID=UPI0015538F6D|nr:IS630 family transposase [Pseudenhygromyxa sp. WMMC2535]NVB42799.1 IS630 family transposase [Pseudenhygromyxa sp. WMMC2535]
MASASKKTPYAPQRDRADVAEERAQFRLRQRRLDIGRLVFVDESGTHPGIGPRRGWSPRGEPLYGPHEPYSRGRNVSMIAALRVDGISALMTTDGGVKTADFLRFVRQRLAPTLEPGDIVCWDNINMHKNAEVVAAVLETGAKVVRLPRYSPDFNPIEAAWAKVKAWIRRAMPTTVSELKKAMRRSLRRIRASDALGWLKYCGYRLP